MINLDVIMCILKKWFWSPNDFLNTLLIKEIPDFCTKHIPTLEYLLFVEVLELARYDGDWVEAWISGFFR